MTASKILFQILLKNIIEMRFRIFPKKSFLELLLSFLLIHGSHIKSKQLDAIFLGYPRLIRFQRLWERMDTIQP